jgi:hypothetical protein
VLIGLLLGENAQAMEQQKDLHIVDGGEVWRRRKIVLRVISVVIGVGSVVPGGWPGNGACHKDACVLGALASHCKVAIVTQALTVEV